MIRQRLDLAIVERGLLPSRARARDAIRRGSVRVNGTTTKKASLGVSSDDIIALSDPASAYVSRAALKLKHGLVHFGFSARDHSCVDIGASTGGFTQVLLEDGAKQVFAFDVGHGQLHDILQSDSRIVSREGLNARDLEEVDLPFHIDFLVSDVSFISLTLALPAALRLAKPKSPAIFLIKPQFEVGKGQLGKGGIVSDHAEALASAEKIAHWLRSECGCDVHGITPSPISGGDGNQEFLVGLHTSG
ncbi:MAG: TlyA family RNA methyltransferase [Hyphomicrobiales bacterium]